jgi:hypothetical protein
MQLLASQPFCRPSDNTVASTAEIIDKSSGVTRAVSVSYRALCLRRLEGNFAVCPDREGTSADNEKEENKRGTAA